MPLLSVYKLLRTETPEEFTGIFDEVVPACVAGKVNVYYTIFFVWDIIPVIKHLKIN